MVSLNAQKLLHHRRMLIGYFLFYTHHTILSEVYLGHIMDNELIEIAEITGQRLKSKGLTLATAESCTGGWISQVITEIAGSSAWFDRGYITYSNTAKTEMLGVTTKTLDAYGAVSAQTAEEMVNGALTKSTADCAIAVTGIAGPDGGTPEKPVGTVFIAWAYRNQASIVIKKHFNGSRHEIRLQTVKAALQGLNV